VQNMTNQGDSPIHAVERMRVSGSSNVYPPTLTSLPRRTGRRRTVSTSRHPLPLTTQRSRVPHFGPPPPAPAHRGVGGAGTHPCCVCFPDSWRNPPRRKSSYRPPRSGAWLRFRRSRLFSIALGMVDVPRLPSGPHPSGLSVCRRARVPGFRRGISGRRSPSREPSAINEDEVWAPSSSTSALVAP